MQNHETYFKFLVYSTVFRLSKYKNAYINFYSNTVFYYYYIDLMAFFPER